MIRASILSASLPAIPNLEALGGAPLEASTARLFRGSDYTLMLYPTGDVIMAFSGLPEYGFLRGNAVLRELGALRWPYTKWTTLNIVAEACLPADFYGPTAPGKDTEPAFCYSVRTPQCHTLYFCDAVRVMGTRSVATAMEGLVAALSRPGMARPTSCVADALGEEDLSPG